MPPKKRNKVTRRAYIGTAIGACGLALGAGNANADCHQVGDHVDWVISYHEEGDLNTPDTYDRGFLDVMTGVKYVGSCPSSHPEYEYEHSFVVFSYSAPVIVEDGEPKPAAVAIDNERWLPNVTIRTHELEVSTEDENITLYDVGDPDDLSVAPARNREYDDVANALVQAIVATTESVGRIPMLPITSANDIYEAYKNGSDSDVTVDNGNREKFEFGPIGDDGSTWAQHAYTFTIATPTWESFRVSVRSLFETPNGSAELSRQVKLSKHFLRHPDGTQTVPVGGPGLAHTNHIHLPVGQDRYRRA